jgi:anti-sigma factor RsiW
MSERPQISAEELHAYIDGELNGVRTADIALLLQYDAERAARCAAFQADKRRLREVYGPLAERPVPQAWIGRIRQHRTRQDGIRRTIFALAASVVVMIAVGFAIYQRETRDPLLDEALAVHRETMPAALKPVQPGTSLAAVLNLPVTVPDLTRYGYVLAGMESYAGVPGGAVKLSYHDAARRSFTLYLRHSVGEDRFDMLKRGKTRICIWQDDVVGAVMVGEMSAGEMLRLATLAYQQLSS